MFLSKIKKPFFCSKNLSQWTLGALAILLFVCNVHADSAKVPAMFPEPQRFLDAIGKEKPNAKPVVDVTGISVPHHLLAVDLIARGFWAAAGNNITRVIVISPDHFNKSHRPMATTRANFDTAFGELTNDVSASTNLLAMDSLFDDSNLFPKEHGIGAILPFVKYFFPNAQIVPIAVSPESTPTDWEAAINALKKISGPHTLIIQSTDYSHYLAHEVAQKRDQETLNAISAENAEAIAHLVHSAHIDSRGSQYIQMRLQAEVNSAHSTVIANRNSEEYTSNGNNTTSYIVTVYSRDPLAGSKLRYPDQETVYFGGDVFVGRGLTQAMANPDVARAVVEQVRSVTLGSPMIINLEGLVLNDPPAGLDPNLHVMHSDLTLPFLEALNVKVAGYANNHSHDLGADGANVSAKILQSAGILPLSHMEIGKLGSLGLIAINFIGARDYKGDPVVKQNSDLLQLCSMTTRSPLFAFVHWGKEYANAAGPTEEEAAETLYTCGTSAVVGAHSHKASSHIAFEQGGEYQVTYSLGNLLFDQAGDRVSGALLEVRVFHQGTFAARLVPLPNLYDLAGGLIDKINDANGPKTEPQNEFENRLYPSQQTCVNKLGNC